MSQVAVIEEIDYIDIEDESWFTPTKAVEIDCRMEYTAIIKEVGNGWYMGQCEQ